MSAKIQTNPIWDGQIVLTAIRDAFLKLSPRDQIRNPVMFTVYIGSILATVFMYKSVFWHWRSATGIYGSD